MKKIRRILALLLTAVMLLSATNISFAAENEVIEEEKVIETGENTEKIVENEQNIEKIEENIEKTEEEAEETEEVEIDEENNQNEEIGGKDQNTEENESKNENIGENEEKTENQTEKNEQKTDKNEQKIDQNEVKTNENEVKKDENEAKIEEKEDDTTVVEIQDSIQNETLNKIDKVEEENISDEINSNDEEEETQEQDVVTYNLGSYAMTVGADEEQAEQVFEADGSYTIELEENAFFPYEVQFEYEGKTRVEWFETADDSVEIGEHTFYVHSENTDENAITQIGVTVDDEYIAARPEAKTFVHDPVSTASLLPLVEKTVTLDFSGFDRYTLNNMELKVMLGEQTLDESKKAVWFNGRYGREHEYKILDSTQTSNIFELLGGYVYDGDKFELLVGDGAQVNPDNMRYIIEVTNVDGSFALDTSDMTVYRENADKRSQVTIERKTENISDLGNENYEVNTKEIWLHEEDTDKNAEYYVGGLKVAKAYQTMGEVKIYSGDFKSAEKAIEAAANDPSIDITAALMNQTMTEKGAGLKISFGLNNAYNFATKECTVVFTKDGKHFVQRLWLWVHKNLSEYELVFSEIRNEKGESASHLRQTSNKVNEKIIYATLEEGNFDTEEFYLKMAYKSDGKYDTQKPDKAVEGYYDSLEDAKDQPDIKDELFSSDYRQKGYKAVYGGQGKKFTAFKDGEVSKFTVIVKNPIGLKAELYNANGLSVSSSERVDVYGTSEKVSFTLNEGVPDASKLYLRLEPSDTRYSIDAITKIVEGNFSSLQAAANAVDIKGQLFGSKGYEGFYGGMGKEFTLFTNNNFWNVVHLTIIADGETSEVKPRPGSRDIYFNIYGIYYMDEKGNKHRADDYRVPYQHDTYYDVGYQTIFYIDDDDKIDISKILLYFYTEDGVKIKTSSKGSTAGDIEVISGKTAIDFSDGVVQFTAATEDGKTLKNYWVKLVKKETGAKLFVNALEDDENGGYKREVFLTSAHKNLHDIFIANVGDAELKGLKAELTDAQNIKLDEYWTVGGTNNDTLAAFTTTKDGYRIEDEAEALVALLSETRLDSEYAELPNVAKIRLLPDGEGEIKGTLTISAEGQEPVVIHLTGNAGDPRLLTDDVPDAVKYVPYSVQLLHNNKYSWNSVSMKITSGKLPDGVELKENGEIYGTPKEVGDFTFTVSMTNSVLTAANTKKEYTLTVLENTNENVDGATDTDYSVSTRVGTKVGTDDIVTDINDHLFVSEGTYGEFIDFWLNGEKLTDGVDYDSEEGSTKITIRKQTFQNKVDKTGTNTIAAEFRVGGNTNNELKRSAQNFKMSNPKPVTPSNPSTPSKPSNPSKPSEPSNPSKPSEPSNPSKPSEPSKPSKPSRPSGSGGGGGGSSSGRTGSVVKPNTTVEAPQPSVAPQPIVEALQPILETIDVPAEVADNKASANTPLDQALQVLENALEKAAGNHAPVQITVNVTGLDSNLDNAKIVLPEQLLNGMVQQNKVSIKINAGHLGNVTLPQKAINDLVSMMQGDLEITLQRIGNTVKIIITKGGQEVKEVSGGIKIAFSGLDNGEVIVLIQTDDVEEIAKKSVVENGNVYALVKGSGIVKVIYNSKQFADVSQTDWYYNPVTFVNSREIFVGLNEKEFAPTATMNRAMMAAVLHRLEDNMDMSGVSTTFQDAAPNDWYYEDVLWAEKAGVMFGYNENAFGAKDKVSREQIAGIMYQYAKYIGIDTIERGDMTQFVDAGQVSAWANDATRWAVATGLLVGDNGNFRPQGDASRAEVAAVLMRFIEKLVK